MEILELTHFESMHQLAVVDRVYQRMMLIIIADGKTKGCRIDIQILNLIDLQCDTNLANKLSGGSSVVIYKAEDGSGVTDEWLSREIAPAAPITSCIDEEVVPFSDEHYSGHVMNLLHLI